MRIIFCITFLLSCPSIGKEVTSRRKDFAQHKQQLEEFDREREAGKKEYEEELELEKKEHERALKEYVREKKSGPHKEEADSPAAFREYLQTEKEWQEEYLKSRREYTIEMKANKGNSDLALEEELDLINPRPRYDHHKRTLYGATSGIKSPGGMGRGSNRAGPSFPSPVESSEDYTPPPPPPLPSTPSYDDDFPPPPPPPEFGSDDFPPPPPPMDDFPPPPPEF